VTLWEIDIYPSDNEVNRAGQRVQADARDLGWSESLSVEAGHGFLIEADLDATQIQRLTDHLLADQVVESAIVAPVGDASLAQPPQAGAQLITVLPKPGVTDPVAQSLMGSLKSFGMTAQACCTLRKYWVSGIDDTSRLQQLGSRLLANESIEQILIGPIEQDHLPQGSPYQFELSHVNIRQASDEALANISREWQLSLTLVEMQTIRDHYLALDRDPTDIELETIAQTWSEHCSHKTLAGRIAYRDEKATLNFKNMLKETIFAATQQIRKDLGDDDWCVSVFQDNAGIVRFTEDYNVAFKVETHNRPSAIEPYGGANTGIGGVIRDTLGTGLGAKPVCNTDVFCFAPPETPTDQIPPGVLHPRRVMKGVVSGVRDYGNRMGIPTVNGAVFFDHRYIGNPLVFCGNVGLLSHGHSFKKPQPNDLIVSIGGRTGRDGIHGATFSSAELTSESEQVSSGAVQIGNAITEKMTMDVLLQARDQGLYSAVTDCGAGGFSSAVGEMGEEIGAEVWLDKAPLKYDGLSYTEIWISEAQERMVFAVPENRWEAFEALCRAEDVEATVIGQFKPTGRLVLTYHGEQVGDLAMSFLHDGRPPVVREAIYTPPTVPAMDLAMGDHSPSDLIEKILGSLNVASKHWIIRQYDHEVQGGSVLKPLVGINNDGPGDAAVIRPLLDSRRGLTISCGMNPHYGDFDPYWMAASAIDEAVRNCVAVGTDPDRIAILDNFCWGYTDRPETLGSLVRAALGCQETAVAFQTPFVSGKDSLNNEFSYEVDGEKTTISIPSTLLISAMGQVNDVQNCVTMDLKQAGSLLYVIGDTHREFGGSHFGLIVGRQGGQVPTVDTEKARRIFRSLHQAIEAGCVRSCHDLSEGGLSVGLAEMAFAGGLGAEIDLQQVPIGSDPETNQDGSEATVIRLFSESNSRFVVEVPADLAATFESYFEDSTLGRLGHVCDHDRLIIRDSATETTPVDVPIEQLKSAWLQPLNWN
jgi:phosphoribosylformylglycinamidine synthase II